MALRTEMGQEWQQQIVAAEWERWPSLDLYRNLSKTRCADDVVGHRAHWKANERQEDGRKDVVPTSASHFAFTKHNGSEQEFHRDPGNVEE